MVRDYLLQKNVFVLSFFQTTAKNGNIVEEMVDSSKGYLQRKLLTFHHRCVVKFNQW